MRRCLHLFLAPALAFLAFGCPRGQRGAQPEFSAHAGATASVRFEIRKAEAMAAEGLEERTVKGRDQVVYLHPESGLSNIDLRGTSVRLGQAGSGGEVGCIIELFFTEKGTAAFTKLTEESIGKPIAILIDGDVVSAPIVRETITGGRGLITGDFGKKADAEATAKGILGK